MPRFTELLDDTLRTARAGRWSEHRLLFVALREALEERFGESEEDLRIRLDTLNSAAPNQDPEGYLAELEQLALLLRECGVPEFDIAERVDTLDLRGMQPPEPIVRILAALERAPDAPLRAILPHEPLPLYGLLRERGFACSGTARADGGFEVLIQRV